MANAAVATRALAAAAAAASPGAADGGAVSNFARKVGVALGAVAALTIQSGFGEGLASAGAAITAASGQAEAVPEGALAGTWAGLDTTVDLGALAAEVQEARYVTDGAEAVLQAFVDGPAAKVAEATKALVGI